MSNYLPSGQDRFTVEAYQPDYSFLQGQVLRANDQFQSGLDQLRSSASSILNAQLTNPYNQIARAEYVKRAKESLKDISRSDIGKPDVIQKAQGAFAPFWSDDNILTDVQLTKDYTSKIQKAYAARDSQDEDIKDTYDERSLYPLQRAYNRMKTSRPEDLKNITVPEWTPFRRIDKDLHTWYSEEEPEISWDKVTGDGRIIHYTNGPESAGGWRTMVAGQIGSQYTPQYSVLGKNQEADRIEGYLRDHPGATEQQARQFLAQELIPELKAHYDGYVTAANAEYDEIKGKIGMLQKEAGKNGLSEDQKRLLAGLESKLLVADSHVKQAKKDLIDIDDPKTVESMAGSLGNHYARSIRMNDVQAYANKYANQNSSVEYKTDDAFFRTQDHNLALSKFKFDQIKEDHEQTYRRSLLAGNATDREIKLKELQLKYPTMFGPAGIPNSSTSELANVVPVADRYIAYKEKQKNTIINGLYGTGLDDSGGLAMKTLMYSPELSADPKAIMDFNDVLTRQAAGEALNTKDPKLANYYKVVKTLTAKTGKTPKTFDEVTDLLIEYSASTLSGKIQVATGSSLEEAKQLNKQYDDIKRIRNEYLKDEQERNEKLQKELGSNPGKYKYSISVKDGKVSLIGAEQMAHYFPKIVLKDNTEITPLEAARLWREGRFWDIVNSKDLLQVGDKKRTPESWFQSLQINSDAELQLRRELDKYITGVGLRVTPDKPAAGTVTALFGKQGEMKAEMETINENIIPNLSFFKNQTAEIGKRYTYNMTGDESNNKQFIRDALLPDNKIAVYDENHNLVKDPAVEEQIRNIVSREDATTYLGDNFNYDLAGFTGNPVLEVGINTTGNNKVDKEVIKGLMNRYFIELNPKSGMTAVLSKLPQKTEKEFLRESEYASPVDKAAGLDWEMHPQGDGVNVVTRIRTIDPKTGAVDWDTHTEYVPYSRKKVSQIREGLTRLKQQGLNVYIENQKIRTKNTKS
jgi:hypothetical protein